MEENELKTGESSIGKTLFHCTKDQLWRYVEALNYVNKGDKVLDLGCGCGYGSLILSHKAEQVIGVDNRPEVIEYANKYYKRQNIDFICRNASAINDKYNLVIACESIEHFKDTEGIFRKLKQIASRVVITVPHISAPNNNKFHYRHFSIADIKQYMKEINFIIIKLTTPKFQGGRAIFCVALNNSLGV